MEHQNIINLLDNQTTLPFKSRTKKWVGINDDLCVICCAKSQIKFKTSILKSRFCLYNNS